MCEVYILCVALRENLYAKNLGKKAAGDGAAAAVETTVLTSADAVAGAGAAVIYAAFSGEAVAGAGAAASSRGKGHSRAAASVKF